MEPWMVPLIWLFIAVLFIIIESMTFVLVSTWFALGAIVAMFVAFLFPEVYLLQAITFIVVSVVSLIYIRNYAVVRLKSKTIKTNVNSLIGKKAVVTKQIELYKYGEVKIDGNYWTAKPVNDETILENDIVEVVEVTGVKLVVKKILHNINNKDNY